ncbi:endonuclease V [Hahella sp. CCB-MM4]|uniref:endonuclease V n=1 Tax=Hahella sp. (strain CCB-MM4) TaxID=1926491 RepID=UPI000B9A2686|nr:endonuclease V [Hahella sp. CCB-MM4]OZG71192.1 endonuclease V [Hahella sp. CCB-MM4]
MILAVDVQYSNDTAFVAGVMFSDWRAESPGKEYVSVLHQIEDYEPGKFYKRELPCILKLLEEHDLHPATIVVDGYVFLDGYQRPGLGKYLFDSLNGQVEVIGVAKKAFAGIGQEHEIYRGESSKPLYVTTSGELNAAKEKISLMFGQNRIPVLLKRVDQLCRAAAQEQTFGESR